MGAVLAKQLGAAREMHSEGLEPPTYGSEDRCSIQLSYECDPIFIGFCKVSRLLSQLLDTYFDTR